MKNIVTLSLQMDSGTLILCEIYTLCTQSEYAFDSSMCLYALANVCKLMEHEKYLQETAGPVKYKPHKLPPPPPQPDCSSVKKCILQKISQYTR
jgi:hypothetical protein